MLQGGDIQVFSPHAVASVRALVFGKLLITIFRLWIHFGSLLHVDPAYLYHNSHSKEHSPKHLYPTPKGPAHLLPETRSGTASQQDTLNPPSDPNSPILRARGIIQLHIVNLRIVPTSRRIIDIEVALNLPIDRDHRTIGAVVRDEDFNLGRPILLFRP